MVKSVETTTIPEPPPTDEIHVGDKFMRMQDARPDSGAYGEYGYHAGDVVTVKTIWLFVVTLDNNRIAGKTRLLDPSWYKRVT